MLAEFTRDDIDRLVAEGPGLRYDKDKKAQREEAAPSASPSS